MSKKCKIAILTAVIIVLALVLAGCGGSSYDTPWEWVQNLSSKDIESAFFWYKQEKSDNDADTADDAEAETEDKEAEDAGEQKIELSEKDVDKLFTLLYRLGESNFTENTKSSDSTRDYGLMINMTDGNVYYILPSVDQQGALEMRYGNKMWFVESKKLTEFIESFLTDIEIADTEAEDDEDKDKDKDDEYASEAELNVYASDGSLYVQEEVDYSTYSNIS